MKRSLFPTSRAVVFLLTAFSFVFQIIQAQENPTQVFLETLRRAQAATKAEQWSEAVPLWEKVVQFNPVDARFWENLGVARYQTKNYDGARTAYETALRLGSDTPANYAFRIARCYGMLGNKEAALKWVEKAFARGSLAAEQVKAEPALALLHAEPRFRQLVNLADTTKMSRTEGWRYDLEILAREAKRRRFHPFKNHSEAEFDLAVKQLSDRVPKLTDMQIIVEMMKLMRRFGDGHTMVYGFWERPEFLQTIPIDGFFFKEGLFVTAAENRYADLLGAEILRFGDRTPAEILQGLDPILNRDNEMGPLVLGWMRMRNLPLVHGLGLIPHPDKVTLTVRDVQGKVRTVELAANSGVPSRKLFDELPPGWKAFHDGLPGPLPLYLKNTTQDYWFEYVPATKTVFFQFNRVRNNPEEPLAAFCERLFTFINTNEVEKLVIDMRWNPGGNTLIEMPLIWGLIRCQKVNRTGRLFVIIGRRTFSAAQNGATYIERHTEAIFVGEPTGSSPNFIGEDRPFELPYSKVMANASTLLWQSSWPFDQRSWIAPLLYAPPTFAMYQANRDPAWEAVMAYQPAKQ